MGSIKQQLQEFIVYVQKGDEVDLYNEAGLQHELAWFLRKEIGNDYIIKLEYPSHKAGVSNKLVKKEMDIYLVHRKTRDRYCIELKTPVNLQVPKIMYHAIKDVKFLSQLKDEEGFTAGFLLFVTHNNDFWQPKRERLEIYKMFRGANVNIQSLRKEHIPTFIKDEYDNNTQFIFEREYQAKWQDLKTHDYNHWRYFLIEI